MRNRQSLSQHLKRRLSTPAIATPTTPHQEGRTLLADLSGNTGRHRERGGEILVLVRPSHIKRQSDVCCIHQDLNTSFHTGVSSRAIPPSPTGRLICLGYFI